MRLESSLPFSSGVADSSIGASESPITVNGLRLKIPVTSHSSAKSNLYLSFVFSFFITFNIQSIKQINPNQKDRRKLF